MVVQGGDPDFCVDEDGVVRAEAALGVLSETDACMALIRLAWGLRERDGTRALELVARALTKGPDPAWRLRAHLVEAHAFALRDAMDAAREALARAEALVPGMPPELAGDLAMTRGHIRLLAGDRAAEIAAYADAERLYAGVAPGDPRPDIARAYRRVAESYRDPEAARAAWGTERPAGIEEGPPALLALYLAYLGQLSFTASDYRTAARHYAALVPASRAAGLMRMAIVAAANVGAALDNLNDPQSALIWQQHALALGRPAGFPQALGFAMSSLGMTLRKLGRLDEAMRILEEAYELLEATPGSRFFTVVCRYLGELESSRGRPAAALPWLEKSRDQARAVRSRELLAPALRALAEVLAALGRVEDAMAAAEEALAVAREIGRPQSEAAALHVLARLHKTRADTATEPERLTAMRAAKDSLEGALAAWERIKGAAGDPDLLVDLALVHEASGDPVRALAFERAAAAARVRIQSQQAADRQAALQFRLETEKSQAEAAHHRDVAGLLERLGAVGRELTATLDPEAVAAMLAVQLRALLPADAMLLYRLSPDGLRLDPVLASADGQAVPAGGLGADGPDLPDDIAAALRDRRLSLATPGGTGVAPGIAEMRSGLSAPLLAEDALLGVLTLRARRPLAYGDRECMIVEALCGYAAVALANAAAYRREEAARLRAEQAEAATAAALRALRAAQDRLVQQEKLAGLGRLVAGVAHELNTPLGVAMTAYSSVADGVERIGAALAAKALGRNDLQDFLETGRQGMALGGHNLNRAIDLVRSFKQLAGGDDRGPPTRVVLADLVAETVAAVHPDLDRDGIALTVTVPPDLVLEVRQGALEQALGQLLRNAIRHAFTSVAEPSLRIRAEAADGRTVLRVEDNGVGLGPEDLRQAFTPFFTTARHRGHVGLGLNIAHNLATGALAGDLTLESRAGEGCRATLILPGPVLATAPS